MGTTQCSSYLVTLPFSHLVHPRTASVVADWGARCSKYMFLVTLLSSTLNSSRMNGVSEKDFFDYFTNFQNYRLELSLASESACHRLKSMLDVTADSEIWLEIVTRLEISQPEKAFIKRINSESGYQEGATSPLCVNMSHSCRKFCLKKKSTYKLLNRTWFALSYTNEAQASNCCCSFMHCCLHSGSDVPLLQKQHCC